jgi:hypothetical protein
MRDITKWALGLGTTLAITLVGAVLDMRSSMSSISATVELTNKHFEKGLAGTNTITRTHAEMLNNHSNRLVRLEGKDKVHDKYDTKLEELLPIVNKIYIIMEKDAKEKANGN